jgi:phosphoglycerol transferase
VNITFPEQKRNLIYIYCESMEMTYADTASGGAFEQNVIPELTELAMENECFAGNSGFLDGGYVTTGTTYTMSALLAQTAGIPINSDGSIGNAASSYADSFYPGATVLGDILADAGYNQEFMCGSVAYFGGRELYFEGHGGYKIFDYKYASANDYIPRGYKVWWGYEDSKMFEFAKSEILYLASQDAPFNFTMLTADTHFEDGYLCDKCGDEFGDQYSNVMKCSSEQVYEFVEWAKQQDFYENTTIIINGDHPTMDADFCENVDSSYQRRTYTCVINPAVEPEQPDKHRTYTTFDNFPTTVAALGATIEGDRLGLGTNLLSSRDTLVEELGVKEMAAGLRKQSKYLQKLSDIDQTFRHGETQVNDSFTAAFIFKESEKHDGQIVAGLKNIKVPKGTILTGAAYEIYSESDESDATMITV